MRSDFAPFLAWSQAKGISTPLELVSNGAYRYMALPANKDTLMSQSKTPDFVNIVTAPLDACIVGEDWETMVEKLTYEKAKGSDSDYGPWLDLFPTLDEFQGMPRFWNSDRADFVSLYDSGQLEARMEIDRLRFKQVDDQWALAVVDSRSNFMPDNTYSMTPMLDMFNHKSNVKTTARVDGGNRFLLEVESKSILQSGNNGQQAKNGDWTDQLLGFFGGSGGDTYKKGAEVYVSYGNFDNMETLCNYGFVEEDNVSNVETFRVRLLGKATAFLVVESNGSVDNMINQLSLADLRVALATPAEKESLKENWKGIGQISERNDVEVFALIAGELEEALYDAKKGAEEAARMGDDIVASYLRGRERTLEKGRDWLKEKYPDVF
jgi:hypothetical protein